METTLDNYLDEIQEDEQLQEIDPITVGVAAGAATLMVLWHLIRMIVGIKSMKKAFKVDKPLSKKLNGILGKANKWNVLVVPDKSPNAFAAGGVHVFITTGLMKILNEREQMAVLLHEVFHNEKKHLVKKVGYEYSLYYLIIYILTTISFSLGTAYLWLAYLAFTISLSILKIPYAIIIGRKHEYGADENTIKYGYGDDLVSGFKKMEIWIAKMMKQQKCGSMCKLVNAISRAIDEHPDMQKRIENILRKKEIAAAAEKGTVGAVKKVVFAAAGIKQK